MSIGRPTDYSDEHCSTVLRMGRDGCSVVEMADEIGVHRDTLYEWEKVHPAFSDAFTRARLAAQAWWERQGRTNLITQGFNSSLWAKNMGCRFKGDWTEKSEFEHSGPGGKPLAPPVIMFQPVAPHNEEKHG